MKSSALSLPASDTYVSVLSGPNKGTTYRVVAGKITMGRGPDNDVVVSDPKSSRNHVEIVAMADGFEIRDITDRNQIRVDGRECKRAPLQDGSVFELGGTQFRFSNRALTAIVKPSSSVPMAGDWNTNVAVPRPMPRSGVGGGLRRRPKGNSNIMWAGAAVIGVAVWLSMNTPPKAKPSPTSEEQIAAEAKAVEKIKESGSSRPKGVSLNDLGYNQAQQAYVAGFQDFRNGQYERALASFQACLSLFPQHQLCNRYMALTQRKFDELVQYHMVYGKKYRDQGQYGACSAAFRNVMVMIKDQGNKRYQEAKDNLAACDAHLEERF